MPMTDPKKTFQLMQEVTREDYERFVDKHPKVRIENVDVQFVRDWDISRFQPEEYAPEEWTVWSFT